MHAIWVGFHARPTGTRILATAGPHHTLLKAQLATEPQHARALPSLLEALALWQGAKVHAALAVDAALASSARSLCRTCFADFGQEPLYTLAYAATRRPPRPRAELRGLGDFRDLRHLLWREVAR